MIFKETNLTSAFVIELEPLADERGFFARTFCREEFDAQGLCSSWVQCNLSYNYRPGTIRGLHYQSPPFAEVKLVRCTKGAVWDVIIDLRASSPTYMRWEAVELTEENHKMIYVPQGFAHGYQTLEEDCEVFYQVSNFYQPGYEKGLRWDDPAFAIKWPLSVTSVSEKDRGHPLWGVGK